MRGYNVFKTGLLLTALTLLLVYLGKLLGGNGGMALAFLVSLGMNFFAYWFSDKLVLAIHRAKALDERQAPKLFQQVRELVDRANLPMPRLYLIENPAPNAFATGRNPQHAALAVTSGLLQHLDTNEVRGVLAHEVAHVNNRDILISSVAATIAGAIMVLSRIAYFSALFGGGGSGRRNNSGLEMLLMLVLAPIAALLIQMAISRSREYEADATGAQIAGDNMSLANALRKLEQFKGHQVQSQPQTSHLFFVKPFSASAFFHLFSTHPPIGKRIERLERLELT